MWTKRTTFDFETDRLTRNLHIVMKQLETRVLSNADPYDTSSPKVREGADSADVHDELAMPSGDRRENILDLIHSLGRLLAEELEGQVKERLANPCELRRVLPKWHRRVGDIASDFGAEVDREEKTHAGFCVSRRPAPTARSTLRT